MQSASAIGCNGQICGIQYVATDIGHLLVGGSASDMEKSQKGDLKSSALIDSTECICISREPSTRALLAACQATFVAQTLKSLAATETGSP